MKFYILLAFVVSFMPLQIQTCFASEQAESFHIYLDADMTHMKNSGTSIQRGIQTALSEMNNTLNGYKIELITLDHRGNTKRSLRNLERINKDPSAIAIFTGLHSPPVLANLSYINENKILTLVPWAAATPITRYNKTPKNWIFRLSVDDSKAGKILVERAINKGARRIALLLENTGWGEANLKTMTKSLADHNLQPASVERFNWGTQTVAASLQLQRILKSRADAILLVANAPEGISIIRSAVEIGLNIPIYSHWGITGGDFTEKVDYETRSKINLEFLQTKFSFLADSQTQFQRNVLNHAMEKFPDVNSAFDIIAPTGFIHAYDLTNLLISAVRQAQITPGSTNNNEKLHQALEHLKAPVQGLIKTYNSPFSPFSELNRDSHEALGRNDLTMGFYGESDEVILIE
ncbi:MAG: ABC transporter substrate-binding protein [Desulfovibrio sp.]